MKKALFLMCFFILIFSSRSFAYTQSELSQAIVDSLDEYYSVDLQNNNDVYGTLANYLINNPDAHLVAWRADNYLSSSAMYVTNVSDSSVTWSNYAPFLAYNLNNNQVTSNNINAGTYSGLNNVHDFGSADDLMNSIDFDNIYYDPILPIPNFSVKNFIHLNDYSIDYTLLVSDQSLSIDDHPLYLMSMIYFYVPETVRVGYNSFTPYNFRKGGPYYIADYSDLELVSYQSYDLDNRFHSDYQEFYDYWANNRNFAGSDEMSAGLLLQRTTQYVDDAAKGIPYMGNGLEVWMRYFYVDEGIVYAGDWKKWNSYRYRDYEKVVAEEEGYPSKGISQTINENDPNTEGDTYNPIGVQTGNVSQTVNVNTNVPNYPDYPTINSFNKDNALVQVIDATSYMADPQNGFFDQFGLFLSNIFKFIPDEIWFVIGTGFSVSIFVMFLKIL